MPDVKHIHLLAPFPDTVYHPIEVRLAAVEQMPEIGILRGYRAPVRMLFQAEDGLAEAPVPFQGGVGVLGVDFGKEKGKVALRSGSEVNDVYHAGFRIRRKIPLPAGACPS